MSDEHESSPNYESEKKLSNESPRENSSEAEKNEPKSEAEKNLSLKRRRHKIKNLLEDSPIKKIHTEKEEDPQDNISEKEKSDNENSNIQENPEEGEPEREDDVEAENDDNNININEEQISDQDPEENEGENSNYALLDSLMKKVKKPQQWKRNRDVDLGFVERETTFIIEEMSKAYDEDVRNLQQKKPALKKIKVFTDVEKALKNYNIQMDFVNRDGLDIFEKWLKPLPDGTQICLFLKRKILETLKTFPLERDQFTKNDIGKVINKICLSPNEPHDLRTLAKTIIDKWTRLLTENHISYRYPSDSLEGDETIEKPKRKSNSQKKNNELDIINSQKKEVKYVLLPQRNSMEFSKNAKSNTSDKKKKEVSEGTKEMYKILQNLRRNKNNL